MGTGRIRSFRCFRRGSKTRPCLDGAGPWERASCEPYPPTCFISVAKRSPSRSGPRDRRRAAAIVLRYSERGRFARSRLPKEVFGEASLGRSSASQAHEMPSPIRSAVELLLGMDHGVGLDLEER